MGSESTRKLIRVGAKVMISLPVSLQKQFGLKPGDIGEWIPSMSRYQNGVSLKFPKKRLKKVKK